MKNGIYYAPKGTELSDPEAWQQLNAQVIEPGWSWNDVANQEAEYFTDEAYANYETSLSFTRVGGRRFGKSAWQALFAARWELRDRLNKRLKGIAPGEPINWKGLK